MGGKETLFKKKILDDPLFLDFIDLERHESLSDGTKKGYTNKIISYCKYTKKIPSQLIREADNEEETIKKVKRRTIHRYLVGYTRELTDKGYAPSTIRDVLMVIKSFYNFHEITLPQLKIKKDKGRPGRIEDLPSKEEIRNMIAHSNPQYQTIILLMHSSGMASAEVRKLRLRDYLDALDIRTDKEFDMDRINKELANLPSNKIPIWRDVKRTKTGVTYTTFSSPESVESFNRYIRMLKFSRYNSFLFPPVKRDGTVLDRMMTGVALSKTFERINKRAKISGNSGKYGLQIKGHAHNLRKVFASTLKSNGMDSLDVEWMLGHAVKDNTGTYIYPNMNSLKKQYMMALRDLTVYEVVDVEIMENLEDITKLKIQIEDMQKQQVDDIKARDEEFKDMQDKIKVLTSIVNIYNDKNTKFSPTFLKGRIAKELDDGGNVQEPINVEKVDLQHLREEIKKIDIKAIKN